MSLTQLRGDSGDTVAPEPSGESVRRLAIEAGKYLGVPSGETVPTDEIREQARANGYGPDETDRLLADAGVSGADRVTVPAQGELFGSLWQPAGPWSGDDTGDSLPDTDSVPADMADRLADYHDWCARKDDGDDRPHHAYSAWRANKWYARANDVDRFFSEVHEGRYSTVHIVLSLEQQAGESVVEHAERLWSRTCQRRLRQALKDCGVYDRGDYEVGYAGLKVRAPRLPSGDSPQSVCALTHLHIMLWIEGDASGANWDAIRTAHCRCDGAHEGNNPPEKAVSVRVHGPPTVGPTGLPVEVGRNLPCCDPDVDTDARELPRPYQLWCSELRHGSDGRLDTRGMDVVDKLGAFDAVADWMYRQRPDDEGSGR